MTRDEKLTLAREPNTPAETLAELAKDVCEYVRQDIARNPNTPAESIAELVNDDDGEVRDAAALHPTARA